MVDVVVRDTSQRTHSVFENRDIRALVRAKWTWQPREGRSRWRGSVPSRRSTVHAGMHVNDTAVRWSFRWGAISQSRQRPGLHGRGRDQDCVAAEDQEEELARSFW